MSQRDEELERKYLRSLARMVGLEELSSEALATSLGLDELTPEKLDAWFETEVLNSAAPGRDTHDDEPRVTQVDPATERPPNTANRTAITGSTASTDEPGSSARRRNRQRRS